MATSAHPHLQFIQLNIDERLVTLLNEDWLSKRLFIICQLDLGGKVLEFKEYQIKSLNFVDKVSLEGIHAAVQLD